MKLINFARVRITSKHQQISATFLDFVNHISNFFVDEAFTSFFCGFRLPDLHNHKGYWYYTN